MAWWKPLDQLRGFSSVLLGRPSSAAPRPTEVVFGVPERRDPRVPQPAYPNPPSASNGVNPISGYIAGLFWHFHYDPSGGAHINEPLDRDYYLSGVPGRGSVLPGNRPTLLGSAEDPYGARRPVFRRPTIHQTRLWASEMGS